jgi:GNAT superfamily N-acetyltransferase
VIVRSLEQRDLPEVIALCAEHAAFERASYDPAGKLEKLATLFFGNAPVLVGKVAINGQSLIGYATASVEVSTWTAERFMHMDCLFVREGHRGSGIGARLMEAIVQEAARLQINQVQWQTPQWNTRADRFYRRLGALACEKFRYTLVINSKHVHAQAS